MGWDAVVAFAQHGKEIGDDQQGGGGRKQKAADHRPGQRGILFLAGAADRHRHHADDHRACRHQNGADTDMASVDRGPERRPAAELLFPREGDQQNRVRGGYADRHDGAHQRGDAERRASDEQHRDDAAQSRRERQDDDERIAEILVVDDHQHINEHGREQEPDAEVPEGIVHALDLAENLNRVARLELLLQLRDDLIDVVGDAAQIAVPHTGIDVVDRLDIGLVEIGGNAVALQRRHVAEEPRYVGNGLTLQHRRVAQEPGYRRTGGSDRGGHRGVAELAERAHLMLGRLDRDVIGNSVRWVGPEIRRYLLRRTEADVEIVGDSLRVETELQCPRPVDVGYEGGRIELLL